MHFRDFMPGFAAVGALGLALGACSKAPPAPEPSKVAAPVATPAVVKNVWTALPADAAPSITQAIRTVPLEGGGELVLTLSCNFRPSPDPIKNGFWLKMEMGLRSANGNLGLDPQATDEQRAQFKVIRSTGETGWMTVHLTGPTDYVYENNQTNELNQDNKDPAKVELATRFDLPLSDGRVITIQSQKSDAGYKDTITRCAVLPQK